MVESKQKWKRVAVSGPGNSFAAGVYGMADNKHGAHGVP